jgi:competence protein ComGC
MKLLSEAFMAKHKKLTIIEIFLILAIIAVFVVWLLPRFLKMLDINSSTAGTAKPRIEAVSGSENPYKNRLRDLVYPKNA